MAESPIKKILIIKTSALGDIVRTFPAIVFVRKKFPNAHIAFMVAEPFVELLEPCPHIDEIIPYKKRRNLEDVTGFLRFAMSLRRRGFDMALNLQNTRRFDWLARVTGAPFRSEMIELDRPMDGVEGVFEILRTAGLDPQRRIYEFWFSPDDHLFAQHFLMDAEVLGHHTLIGINPAGGWDTKQWPLDNYARLVDKLAAALPEARFIVFGSPEEAPRALEIASLCRPPVIIAAGKTTIRQAARLIRECSAFVSNDSGLMHVAAIQDIPTVAIFGPTNPAYHGPCREGNIALYKGVDCSPCYKPECTLDMEHNFCINSITVDEAFKAVRQVMR
jgi:ADP-heptose:LPS heptosyltransferase